MAETLYSLEQINDWQSGLKDFAKTPRTRFSKKQAVEAMIDEIEAALLAHPYEQVAEKLKALGLDIAPGSLKQYVNAYRREQGTAKPVKKRSARKTKRSAKKRALVGEDPAGSVAGNSRVNSNGSDEVKAGKRKTTPVASGFLEMDEDL